MTEPLYIARMMAWHSYAGNPVWKCTFKDGTVAVKWISSMESEPYVQPTHFFKSGKGSIKVTKRDSVEFIPAVAEVKSYEDVFNIVQQHGTLAAAVLIGFQESSFGDQHPIREISYFESIGRPYLLWLDRIAAIDDKILRYFEKHGARFKNLKPYDLWVMSGADSTYQCSFRQSPFLASYLETAIMGVVALQYPTINNVDWAISLRLLLAKHCGNPKIPVSDKEMLAKMVGKEDAEWLAENLSLSVYKEFLEV